MGGPVLTRHVIGFVMIDEVAMALAMVVVVVVVVVVWRRVVPDSVARSS